MTDIPASGHEYTERDLDEHDYHHVADGVAAAKAFAGGDLTYLDERAELPPLPSGEQLVVRSLRIPLELELRVKTIAASRGVPPTVLMREWIIDGVEAGEAGTPHDPVTELHRIADAATRALRLLENRPDAA